MRSAEQRIHIIFIITTIIELKQQPIFPKLRYALEKSAHAMITVWKNNK